MKKIIPAVIGLGYVGLPIFLQLKKKVRNFGFDIDKKKILKLKKKIDVNNQFRIQDFNNIKKNIYTHKINEIKHCNFFIVTVPTPIYKNKNPNLSHVISATKLIAKILKDGDIIIYESTVYPGVTEKICIPILEKYSNLKNKKNFSVGYSPERINPGDKKHTLKKITKVVAYNGNNHNINIVKKIYSIISKNIYFCKNIEEAELSKVFENIQRDVNISLFNELFIICKKMNININNVIKIAKTKWNFISFAPGLVGGHCLPVDPYYLSYIAKKNNVETKVILAGRQTNDNLKRVFLNEIIRSIKKYNLKKNRNILVAGLTYKNEVSDIRHSLAYEIFFSLKKRFKKVSGFDPLIHRSQVEKLKISNKIVNFKKYSLIIFLTKHKALIKIYNKIKYAKNIKILNYMF